MINGMQRRGDKENFNGFNYGAFLFYKILKAFG